MLKLILKMLPLFLSTLAFSEVVYVHSAKASLLAESKFNASTLIVLELGTELTLVEREKRWVKVEHDNVIGWVSILLVRADPPISKVKILGSESVNLEGEARIRASAVATAGAIRGLSAGGGSTGIESDYNELSEMEALSVSLQQVNEFALSISQEFDQ